MSNTDKTEYTNRLVTNEYAWWKQLLDVQRPYRNNIQSLNLGFTLDIGCGIGRNLLHIEGNGVGVDHNVDSVDICKSKGLTVFTSDDFKLSKHNKTEHFDSILLSHVVEHLTKEKSIELLKGYLPLLKSGGKIVIITPQEAGYKSDHTHIEFTDFNKVKEIYDELNITAITFYSFPFVRFIGKFFKYNEFISVGKK